MKKFADILNLFGFFLLLEPYPFLGFINENFIHGKMFDGNSIREKWYIFSQEPRFNSILSTWTMNESRKAIGFLFLFIGSTLNVLFDF